MFIVAGGGVTIASVELDGANDELDLKFFGLWYGLHCRDIG